MTLVFAWLLAWAAGIAVYCAFDTRRGAGLAGIRGRSRHRVRHAAGRCDGRPVRARRHRARAASRAVAARDRCVRWRRRWRSGAGARRMPAAIAAPRVERWKIILLAAGILSVVYRGYLALREILLRPTFPWDAWDAWAVKSKTWFLLGHYAPFVSATHWIDARRNRRLHRPGLELSGGARLDADLVRERGGRMDRAAGESAVDRAVDRAAARALRPMARARLLGDCARRHSRTCWRRCRCSPCTSRWPATPICGSRPCSASPCSRGCAGLCSAM